MTRVPVKLLSKAAKRQRYARLEAKFEAWHTAGRARTRSKALGKKIGKKALRLEDRAAILEGLEELDAEGGIYA